MQSCRWPTPVYSYDLIDGAWHCEARLVPDQDDESTTSRCSASTKNEAQLKACEMLFPKWLAIKDTAVAPVDPVQQLNQSLQRHGRPASVASVRWDANERAFVCCVQLFDGTTESASSTIEKNARRKAHALVLTRWRLFLELRRVLESSAILKSGKQLQGDVGKLRGHFPTLNKDAFVELTDLLNDRHEASNG